MLRSFIGFSEKKQLIQIKLIHYGMINAKEQVFSKKKGQSNQNAKSGLLLPLHPFFLSFIDTARKKSMPVKRQACLLITYAKTNSYFSTISMPTEAADSTISSIASATVTLSGLSSDSSCCSAGLNGKGSAN